MSLWQFHAALNGYADVHDPNRGRQMDDDEFDALGDMLENF